MGFICESTEYPLDRLIVKTKMDKLNVFHFGFAVPLLNYQSKKAQYKL